MSQRLTVEEAITHAVAAALRSERFERHERRRLRRERHGRSRSPRGAVEEPEAPVVYPEPEQEEVIFPEDWPSPTEPRAALTAKYGAAPAPVVLSSESSQSIPDSELRAHLQRSSSAAASGAAMELGEEEVQEELHWHDTEEYLFRYSPSPPRRPMPRPPKAPANVPFPPVPPRARAAPAELQPPHARAAAAAPAERQPPHARAAARPPWTPSAASEPPAAATARPIAAPPHAAAPLPGFPLGVAPGRRAQRRTYPRGHPLHTGPRLLYDPLPPHHALCRKYNREDCTGTLIRCPFGRVHACSECGGDHPASQCTTEEEFLPLPDPPQGPPQRG